MNNLILTSLSRREFLDLMGGSNLSDLGVRASSTKSAGVDGDLIVVSDKGSRSDRNFVVAMPDASINEFFAFTSTYISDFRPYSAYHRVISFDTLDIFKSLKQPDSRSAEWIGRIKTGAALAEHFLSRRSQGIPRFKSNLAGMGATLSACLGTAVEYGYPLDVLFALANNWSLLNAGASPDRARVEAFDIALIWQVLSRAMERHSTALKKTSDNEHKVHSFLQSCVRARRIDAGMLSELTASLSLSFNLADILSASREERIKRLNEHLESMQRSYDQFIGPFLAGLLLAIAGNGSFEMLLSSKNMLERSAAGIIWFGICASLFEESNVMSFSDCLGRRFIRDRQVSFDLFSVPSSDLDIAELGMMQNEPAALTRLVSEIGELVKVEVFPGINTLVNLGGVIKSRDFNDSLQFLTQNLKEIQVLVDRTQRGIARLTEPKQREMFESNDGSRGRKR